MIYIYNENESKQWEITGSEGGTRRVQLINNPDFGINILDEFIMNEPKLYITDGVKYYVQQYDKLHQ